VTKARATNQTQSAPHAIYIVIPALEVDIESLYNVRRDIPGVRQWSISAETMGVLIILRDQLIQADKEREAKQEAKKLSKSK
jgi:hypothetical protein